MKYILIAILSLSLSVFAQDEESEPTDVQDTQIEDTSNDTDGGDEGLEPETLDQEPQE